MEHDFTKFPLEELTRIYMLADSELQNALLNGSSWEEAKEKRALVTKISIEIHKRKYPLDFSSPADTPFREI